MRERLAALAGVCAIASGAAVAEPAKDEAAPLALGATYVTDILADVDGGRRRGIGWLGRADVTARLDGTVIGIDGATFFLDVLATHRGQFSDTRVGDAQTVSNVQSDGIARPYEAWISLTVARGLTVKTGLVDLNTEFDVQETGALFINSSHGIGPDFSQSGRNGPSIFPVTAAAAVVRYGGGGWQGRIGVFGAVAGDPDRPGKFVVGVPGADGALVVAEADRRFGAVKLQLGGWRYTTRFAALDPARPPARSQGAYALAEMKIGRVDSWLRIGLADRRTNPIGAYLGGGIATGGEASRVGLAVAHARLGGPGRAYALGSRARRAETAIELTWARAVSTNLTVQPNLQYVVNPGWEPGRRNALVVGTRLRFAFGR